VKLFFLIFLLSSSLGLAAGLPVPDGLALWLDASVTDSMKVDQTGRVTEWRDRRSNGLVARSTSGPLLLKKSLGGKDLLRFDGKQFFEIKDLLKNASDATVFLVFRRSEDQANQGDWQKIMTQGSSQEGVYLSTDKKSGALSTRVLRGSYHQNLGDDLFIGESGGKFHGEIAELLVYKKGFYVEEPMAKIVAYLEKKWGFKEDRSSDWTHVGPLPATPKRETEKLPLSDQKNEGKWFPHQEMWDEFEATDLDDQKWWDHNPTWYGRPPARYLARDYEERS